MQPINHIDMYSIIGKFIVIQGERLLTTDYGRESFVSVKVFNKIEGLPFKEFNTVEDLMDISLLERISKTRIFPLGGLRSLEADSLRGLGFPLHKDFEKEFCITVLKVVK